MQEMQRMRSRGFLLLVSIRKRSTSCALLCSRTTSSVLVHLERFTCTAPHPSPHSIRNRSTDDSASLITAARLDFCFVVGCCCVLYHISRKRKRRQIRCPHRAQVRRTFRALRGIAGRVPLSVLRAHHERRRRRFLGAYEHHDQTYAGELAGP